MARERCLLIVLFTMPTAVVLSKWMGVGGCGWPISSNVIWMILASKALRKRAPNLASAVDAATHLRMEDWVIMAPLRRMGHPSSGTEPRKKWLPALLLALGAVR